MTACLAAYNLGRCTLGLSFALRYSGRLPWHLESDAATQNSLNTLDISIQRLKNEFTDTTSILQAALNLKDVEVRPDAFPSASRKNLSSSLRDDIDTELSRCEALTVNVERSLANHPRLHWWLQFGLAMGHCYLDLLDDRKIATMPSFRKVLVAVKNIPAMELNSIPTLAMLAHSTPSTGENGVIDLICVCLDRSPDVLERGMPSVAIIHRFRELDSSIIKSLGEKKDEHLLDVRTDDPNTAKQFWMG
jgi:hypothetical protein